MTVSVTLPKKDGTLETFALHQGVTHAAPIRWNRTAYAAAHVVTNPLADNDPWHESAIDWDKTLAFRQHLWAHGFGVAEAMDTAQRGMGMDWPTSLELIRRSVALARDGGHLIACGAGSDHLNLETVTTIDEVIEAYEEQCQAIEAEGGKIILMASRALAKVATSPDDYHQVYGHILNALREPVILHWLGDMFDPQLKNYWGSNDPMRAMETCLAMIHDNAAKIDGIKISLLSAEKEIAMRRRLPAGVKIYTGDDFNYPEMIAGDGMQFSHALLGIFDPIAPVATKALNALAQGDMKQYEAAFSPTVPLSRHIFKAPTQFYKTGVVFLAYLNGHQDHFTMLGGQQSARSALHLAQIVRLASQAGLFVDLERVAKRVAHVMRLYGVGG